MKKFYDSELKHVNNASPTLLTKLLTKIYINNISELFIIEIEIWLKVIKILTGQTISKTLLDFTSTSA